MWDPDIPFVTCPKCGAVQADAEEFGFIRCDECGYCIDPFAQATDDGTKRGGDMKSIKDVWRNE